MNDALNAIADRLRADLIQKNAARDLALAQSRELTRYCAEAIRAVHRREWADVDRKLTLVDQHAVALSDTTRPYPDLFYSGYTQDALKERVEAHLTNAIVRGLPLPDAVALGVESAVYLNGLCEAATELRRFILDIMRREEAHSAEAERLLDVMDAIYDLIITFDFPDVLTGGLRRQTDVLRGVLERTRGDLTLSLRQQRLYNALQAYEPPMR